MLLTSTSSGRVQTFNELSAVCFTISKNSQYKSCPGFDEKNYLEQYHAVIRYHIKGIRICLTKLLRLIASYLVLYACPLLNVYESSLVLPTLVGELRRLPYYT